jgi:protein associated with RNAse G/E
MREFDWHAVWVSVLGNTEGWQWYVNLQEPFVRTPSGIRATDLMLDIVVDHNRVWRWKDEEDFEALLATGLADAQTVESVRRDAERSIERIERGDWPFDGSWLDWRPDPTWPQPELPNGWERLPGT